MTSQVDAIASAPLGFANLATRHPLLLYFGLAYALAWAVMVPMVVFRAPITLIVVASFAPTAAALITHRLASGDFRAFAVYTGWRRMLLGGFVGVVLVLVAYVILPAVSTADPRALQWSALTSLAVYGYSTLLGGPLGEEPGWRGYALPRLQARFSPVVATLILAVIWTGWHAPLFFYSGWTSATPWSYLLIVTGLSFILTYATNLARFSIVVPILAHAIFNTASRFLGGLFANVQPSTELPFTVVMGLAGLAVAIVLIVATKGRLGNNLRPWT